MEENQTFKTNILSCADHFPPVTLSIGNSNVEIPNIAKVTVNTKSLINPTTLIRFYSVFTNSQPITNNVTFILRLYRTSCCYNITNLVGEPITITIPGSPSVPANGVFVDVMIKFCDSIQNNCCNSIYDKCFIYSLSLEHDIIQANEDIIINNPLLIAYSSSNCCDIAKNSDQFNCCPTLISCNTSDARRTVLTSTLTPITSLNVNVSCIENPCNHLEFTSFLSVTADPGTILPNTYNIIIRVDRSNYCYGIPVSNPIENQIIIEIPAVQNDTAINVPLTFPFCDCINSNNLLNNCCCNDNENCYIYTFKASTNLPPGTGTVAFSNPSFSATTTCGSGCC